MYGAITFFMSSCLFEENQSGTSGGTILVNDNSLITMENSRLVRNRSGLGGGALLIRSSYLEISNTTFEGNSADVVNGGTIQVGGMVTMMISSSTFLDNSTLHSGSGGAIYSFSLIVMYVVDTTFRGNYADGLGGAVMVDINSSISIKNNHFHYNSDRDSGGALGGDRYCTIIAENSTFNGNTAVSRACLYLDVSDAYFTNCIIADNVATSYSGFADVTGAKLKLSNAELLNNEALEGRDLYVEPFLRTGTELLTYRTLFTHGNLTIHSTDKHFKQDAITKNLISLKDTNITIKETPYASGTYNTVYLF